MTTLVLGVTNTSSACLLSLPPEIRHRVYELLFENMEVQTRPASIVIESARARKMHPPLQRHAHSTKCLQLAILQVCRQTLHEAEPVFYRTARFHVDVVSQRAVVPTEKLYRMRHFTGGAELRQLLERDEFRSSRRKKYSIMGPFEPDRIQADSLVVSNSMSHPVMNYIVQEANSEAQHPVSFGTYLPGLSACVF